MQPLSTAKRTTHFIRPATPAAAMCWAMGTHFTGMPGIQSPATIYQYAYWRALQVVRESSEWRPTVSLN